MGGRGGSGTSVARAKPGASKDGTIVGGPLKEIESYFRRGGGVVAVSSVGTQQNKESKRLFLRGYEEMMKRLSPEWVIFYGRVPEECDWNVIRVQPHYDEIVKRRK